MATGSDFGPSKKGRGGRSFRGRGRGSPRLGGRRQTTEGSIVDADDDVFGSWKGRRGAEHRRHHYPGSGTQRSWGFQDTSWRDGPLRESNSANRWGQEETFRNDRRLGSEPVPPQRYENRRDRGDSHRASALTSYSHFGERGTPSADDYTWGRTQSSAYRRKQIDNQKGSRESPSAGKFNKPDVRKPGVAMPASKLKPRDDSIGGKMLLLKDDAEDGSGADSKSWKTSRGGRKETGRRGGSRGAEGSDRMTRGFFRRPGIRKQAASARGVDDTEGLDDAWDLAHEDPSQEQSDSDSEVTDSTAAVDTRSKGHRAQFQVHPRRQATKRTPRVPALPEQDLRSLLEKNLPDVLEELAKKKDQFLSLLNGDELADETLLLTVRVVSRLIDLDQKIKSQYSTELNTVFSMIESSLFTSKHLTRYIVSSSTKQSAEFHDNSSVAQVLSADFSTMLKFLQLILEYKPSSCPEVSVALILLQKEVTSASLNNESFDLEGCLMTEMEQVSEICSSLSESQRMAKRRSFEKPPPNNFRDIPIFPKSTELCETGQPFVRKNIIRGKYDNVEHYLDVQFRLLREDFVAPLREGVTEFLSDSTRRPRDIRIYYNVAIEGTAMVRHQLVHTLSFELRRRRPENWESSKRLLYGSFVCLTTDRFRHIYCATIADRSVKDLSKGLVNVSFLTPPSRTTQGPFIMVESSAYFEAYRHVLLGLQEIKERNFPFKKYIVDASSKVDPPLYLQDGNVYDMRSLVVGSDESFNYDVKTNTFVKSAYVPILEPESWPLAEDLHLDESQKAALQTALTKEFAIIQGPPGTGKTYIGLKIVELLLYNAPWKYNHDNDEAVSPILVVCYTNHALDQFLEGIIAFGEENVIRVGGRSSSEILESRNLSVVRRNMLHDKGEYRERMTRLNTLEIKLSKLEGEIQSLILKQQLPKRAIMNLTALSEYIKPTHLKELLPEDEESEEKKAPESDENSKERMEISSENLLKWLNVDFLVEEKDEAEYDEGSKADEPSDRIDVDVEGDAIQRERQLDDMIDREVPQTKLETIFSANVAHDMKSILDTSSVEELQRKETMTDQEAVKVKSICLLKPRDRWRLYRSWVKTFKEILETNLFKQRVEYQECSDEIDGLREKENLKVLRESSVVGMTTTGAAKHRSLLQLLGPRVVVVEEAAEVLEAHIITTLTSKCQHLILIGDHQQLKPNPTVYRLAKMFNLDTSLFERMINNSMQCQSLMHQHRMRPEISLLMRKHFYSRIEDDESVLGRDDIKGVERNLFFITHEQLEDSVDDNKTRSNQYEAEVLVALCKYLLQQGYGPSQITILTTYTGQLFCFRRLMDKETFEGVRVCVVDNFQGEENDIILLSLVRSNEEGSIGFLRTSNRVCVALSRAKLGLYCIGNATILKMAQIWHDILGTLEAENQIGASLPLVCQNHPTTKTQVTTADDFKQKAPCGGCDITCDFRLLCGHVCRLFCHPVDPEHTEYKCMKSCERLCERGHPCFLKCYKPCKPCDVEVTKVMPKCGHDIRIPCHEFDKITCPEPCQTHFEECHHYCQLECGQPCPKTCPEKCERTLPCDHACTEPCGSPCTSYCEVEVEKGLPDCSHTLVTDCGNIFCPEKCEKMLKCGHLCTEICGKPCITDCMVDVKKPLPTCGHGVLVKCFKNVEEIECKRLVQKTWSKCGHEITVPCNVDLDSFETAENKTRLSFIYRYQIKFRRCEEIVEKTHPSCGHVTELPCHQDVVSVRCKEIVEKTHPSCGHVTEFPCHQDVVLVRCKEIVEKTHPSCGHVTELPCRQDVVSVPCSHICGKLLTCGHFCPKKCREPCTTRCRVQVEKTRATCGHSILVKCYKNVEEIECTALVEKTRSKCGHKITVPCSVDLDSIETAVCEEIVKNKFNLYEEIMEKTYPSCGHVAKFSFNWNYHTCETLLSCGHRCRDNCGYPCSTLCRERCNKILACGHPCPNKCHELCPDERDESDESDGSDLSFDSAGKCKVLVEKTFSECGHSQVAECWKDIASLSCRSPCKKKLPCRHVCTLTCGEPCICRQVALRKLPKCRHVKELPCYLMESYKCQEIYRRVLACGHKCFFKCWEVCQVESSDSTENKEALTGSRRSRTTNRYSTIRKCEKVVIKKFADCGHSVKLYCHKDIKTVICSEKCDCVLACGHPCPNKCGEPCPGTVQELKPRAKMPSRLRLKAKPATKCTAMVLKDLSCGHRKDAECWQVDANISCTRNCTGILACGHRCSGTCSSCKNSTRHIECKETCKKQLLCGHACIKRCAVLCSPECKTCRDMSNVRHPVASEPEPCKHNIWNRQLKSYACILPCRQIRQCAHPCMGVCGEPCPPFCRVCDKDTVLGKLSTKHMRPKDTFVYLVDCGHLCETRFLDTMMSKFQATLESGCVEVRPVLCPKCKEPIFNCPRYENLLKMIKSSVDAVKSKCAKTSARLGIRYRYAAEPDREDSGKFSFALGRWMRCPQGHVFYVEENMNERQKPTCQECAKP